MKKLTGKICAILRLMVYYIGHLIIISSPYVFGMVVMEVYEARGYWAIGGEAVIPAIMMIVGYAMIRVGEW